MVTLKNSVKSSVESNCTTAFKLSEAISLKHPVRLFVQLFAIVVVLLLWLGKPFREFLSISLLSSHACMVVQNCTMHLCRRRVAAPIRCLGACADPMYHVGVIFCVSKILAGLCTTTILYYYCLSLSK